MHENRKRIKIHTKGNDNMPLTWLPDRQASPC